MRYKELFAYGVEKLKKAQIAEAELDARLLLEAICATNRSDLLIHGDREVEHEQEKSYINDIEKREQHIPLQHILGYQEFMGLQFYVNQNVLIPRQDTEILVEEVLRNLHDGMKILDICTGSGCILISLLHYSNYCVGTGTDLSLEALKVAERNASQLGVKALFFESDLFENIQDKFDIIVSNPPYIASHVIPELMTEVRDFEPLMALDGKEDGLFFYREIIKQAISHLNGGGGLFFEIGYDQGEAVAELMKAAEFIEVEIIKDFAGLDRVVCGYHI